ncbi:MAG: WYL domain-containing protein [Notoacmeibacter sp.]|nr:WYL domain-containing protein [Notoacmeibacter sp.]
MLGILCRAEVKGERGLSRYGRHEDLLRLALLMQGTADGVSLADIMDRFGVARRTAERMRDAIQNVYPQLEELVEERGHKRWRFPVGTLGRMAEPTLDELTAAHRAAEIARREGDEHTADALEGLAAKVKGMFRADRRRQIEVDLEAQLLGDGVAFRPGPHERIAPEILSTLRHAILAGVMISADHRARSSGKLSRNARLGPIALLLGDGRQYLLAWSEYQDDLRLFALIGFERIVLQNEGFERPADFDLQEWLAGSFGVWREEPFDVEWRFLPDVADEAATFQFHPKQEAERLEDGSLIVRFHAGGRQEMDWYLYRWGDRVEVLKPAENPQRPKP